MSNWIRKEITEDAYEELHGIKPQIYFEVPIKKNENTVKIIFGGKEIILQEILKNGLTNKAILRYSGETMTFETVYEAEQEATRILRG